MEKLEQEIAKIRNKNETPLKDWLELNDFLNFLNNSDSNEEVLMYFLKDIDYKDKIEISGIFVKDDKTANFYYRGGSIIQEYGNWSVGSQVGHDQSSVGDNDNNFEPFCFIKYFKGRTDSEGIKYVEIYQKVIHLLDIYFVPHKNAYCLYDNLGDLIEVIKIHLTGEYHYITIKRKYLNYYLRLNNLTLVKLFECTRIDKFLGWNLGKTQFIKENGIDAHAKIQDNASYIIGKKIVEKHVSPLSIDEELPLKKYETFKIYDWRHQKRAEISCNPEGLCNYFNMKENDLPHELSTAFFKEEVLSRYRTNPDKYNCSITPPNVYISCKNNGWSLEKCGVDKQRGLVFAFLHRIAQLPYSEQLYWKSFNVVPPETNKYGGIPEECIKTYFLGEFRESSLEDKFDEVFEKVKQRQDIWNTNSSDSIETIIDENSKTWADNIGKLYNIFLHRVKTDTLKKKLKSLTPNPIDTAEIDKLRSVALFNKIISAKNLPVDKLNILTEIKDIRNGCSGHQNQKELKGQTDKAKEKFGSLKKHYENLIVRLTDCLNFLLDNI